MDTLALGIIAIGVVAAIGVAVVAMSDSGTQATGAQASTEAATPPVAKPSARPRARRRPQAVPAYVVAPPQHNGYATGNDPLVEGFMQVVSGELDALRSQQEKIDQRLKLINGIAELMHDMQPAAANNNGHRRTTAKG